MINRKKVSYFFFSIQFIILLIGFTSIFFTMNTKIETNIKVNDFYTNTKVVSISISPTLNISTMYTLTDGNIFHSTTRGTIDLVYRNQGNWFAFHAASQGPGQANGFQTSPDGINWSTLKTGSGYNNTAFELARSYLFENDTITRAFPVDRDPNPSSYNMETYIGEGTIIGTDIIWDTLKVAIPYNSTTTGDSTWFYYVDLKRDSTGRIHFTGCHIDTASDKNSIFWNRALNANNLSQWETPTDILHGNFGSNGVDAHENIQLRNDEVYVLGRTHSNTYVPGSPRGFYGIHYNGSHWESTWKKLGTSDGISGSDRRLSGIYDPTSETIHCVFIDDNKDMYHCTLSSPFNSSDWTTPVLVKSNAFTCTMGIDTTVSPARIALVYGDELIDSGGRHHYGDLYLKWYNNSQWESNDLLISENTTDYNWYPNMIRDSSGDIGVMYLKGVFTTTNPSADIMFSLIKYPYKNTSSSSGNGNTGESSDSKSITSTSTNFSSSRSSSIDIPFSFVSIMTATIYFIFKKRKNKPL